MKKRGARCQGKVRIRWSHNFAYAIGLVASDGCLSKDGCHISFVSKDIEQIKTLLGALCISRIKVGKNYSMSSGKKTYCHRVQFSDVYFWNFLITVGLCPAKSKRLKAVHVPDRYFFDFVRGYFDGDGTFSSYWDKRWPSSFMFYTEFASASETYIVWLRREIYRRLGVHGHITKAKQDSTYKLKYAKSDSLKLVEVMYKRNKTAHLKRKKLKIDRVLAMIGKFQQSY